MKKYQITEISGSENHAGTKATADCAIIAERLGFEKLFLKMATTKAGSVAKVQRQIAYCSQWQAIYRAIAPDSVVLLQEPFHYPQLTREKTLTALKNKKHVRFVSIIHDVEELRKFRYNDYYRHEFEFMLRTVDRFIVHNERMKHFFMERGVAEDRIVCLGIFDYLQPESDRRMPTFARSVTVAGNLDVTKCGYIRELNQIGVKVNLFGPNFADEMRGQKNVCYHGSFPADVIPSKLTEGFGLVWDGSSIHGCQGDSGQYLRYNNPHKLSLYLSSGLPVIIWSEAAEADFVRRNKVGLCVGDLMELPRILNTISVEDYRKICENTNNIQKKLSSGYYFESALKRVTKVNAEY
ncbi:MAG: hypothetical protein PUB14_05465 [Lachnospiraceae bacterium]|nr:hypothetical protein [Lachnospiraceae bacterium]